MNNRYYFFFTALAFYSFSIVAVRGVRPKASSAIGLIRQADIRIVRVTNNRPVPRLIKIPLCSPTTPKNPQVPHNLEKYKTRNPNRRFVAFQAELIKVLPIQFYRDDELEEILNEADYCDVDRIHWYLIEADESEDEEKSPFDEEYLDDLD